jgi:hypothetical protein
MTSASRPAPSLRGWPLLDAGSIACGRAGLDRGAGGGFDVFCGLPLYFTLRAAGHPVWLANLTFSSPIPRGAQLHPALVEPTFG